MEEKRFDTKEQLVRYLQNFGNDCLFRGQASHYELKDGSPSLSSSISRSGCIPPLMFKWTHYGDQILRLGWGEKEPNQHLDLVQALLQHYGWRSFYIDLSSSYNVAAWFGGYKFSMKMVMEITEDCYEDSILLAHDEATFTPIDNDGHLYVLSKSAIERSGKTIVDLTCIPEGIALRPHRQQGWLAGPIPFRFGSKMLDPACVVAHVISPASILREIAKQKGFTSTSTLFPDSKDDLFLRYLLSLPWTKVEKDKELPRLFVRELRIPEYDFQVTKPYPPEHAFWTPFWIADHRASFSTAEGKPEGPLLNAMFYKVSESIFYAKPTPEGIGLEYLHRALQKGQALVVETANLLRYPVNLGTEQYTKGIAVLPVDPSRIEVCEVILDHPGTQITGVAVNKGYRYRWIGNKLERAGYDGDCPCGNENRHLRLLAVLETLNEFIPKATKIGPLSMEIFPPEE